MFLECDYDGKFLFVHENLKKYFNYLNKDFIASNRLFNLVHSDSIIDFLNFYDSVLKINFNNIKCNFIFIGSNLKKINCTVYVEKKNNKIKFNFLSIGKTTLIEKKNNFFKQFLFLTRAKFIIGSLMPFFFAIPWCFLRYKHVSLLLLFLLFLSLVFLHIAANTFNDYFDWKSGRDKKNVDYVLFSTGGSRSIDLKLISEKNMLNLSLLFLFLVFIISFYFIYLRGFFVLFIGLLGVFCVYFYSAPPIHLASRHGLGELMHIVCLGPLIIYSTVYIVIGLNDYLDFLIGVPHGLLITGCLLMNELPDSKFDKLSGKNNLAVVLGLKYIPYIYSMFIIFSFLLLFLICLFFNLSYIFLLPFILLPYSFYTCKLIFSLTFDDRKVVYLSCIRSLNIYLYYSIMLIISCVLIIFLYP